MSTFGPDFTAADLARINARNKPKLIERGKWSAPVDPPTPPGRPKSAPKTFEQIRDAKVKRLAKRQQQRDAKRIAARTLSEHAEQCLLIQWWDLWAPSKGIDYRSLAAVPNAGAGAQSGQAGKMRAEGVRAGYPDLLLDIAAGGYNGLRIELKSRTGRVEPHQDSYHALLRSNNYKVEVCYGAEAAIDAISGYLGLQMASTKAPRQPVNRRYNQRVGGAPGQHCPLVAAR